MSMAINLKLCPKTLPGFLAPQNRGSCDWGWQGMMAYGCQNVVVVVETQTLQMIQALDRHKHPVVKVKWSRENYHHDLMSSYGLRLASADSNGRVIVWDVAQAALKSEFQDGQKAIVDVEWLSHQDASHDLLAVLHPNSTLALWNADTGTKLWKKIYNEQNLLSFTFDPFDHSHVAFLGQECVLFIDDFSVTKPPTNNGKHFYISSPGGGGSNQDKGRNKNTLTKRMTRMLVGEPAKQRTQDESVQLTDCLQLTYHRSRRHHIILVYPREVLILDLEINQTVGIIPIDRSGSPFNQVISCRQRDVLICQHDNGSIALRVCRRGAAVSSPDSSSHGNHDDPSNPVAMELIYDLRCLSDALRVTKHLKVYGMAYCPITEKSLSLILSDGKTLLWELKSSEFKMEAPQSHNQQIWPVVDPLYTPGYNKKTKFSFPCLGNDNKSPIPKSDLASMFGQVDSSHSRHNAVQLKFILTGMMNGITGLPHVIKMCPPLTTKNYTVYKPLLAIGTNNGTVQVADLSHGQIWREYSVHTCQVKGIEWISLTSFLSFAFPTLGSSGLIRNELVITDTNTGDIQQLRQNKDEESPIDFIRISHLKLYFVIAFKDKPFELWDLKNCSLLREMPKNFPHITALEWSPSHYLKSLRRKETSTVTPSDTTNSSVSMNDVITPTAMAPSGDSMRLKKNSPALAGAREHFVFTDSDGLLYHFIVEGNVIKEGTKVPPDGGMGSITYIAWKGDVMIMGDVDGNLSLWDLRSRVSKAVPLHRGWIHKIKFAPGKANQKIAILFNDGVEIWDSKEIKVISSIRCPKELPKVLDIDWACSGEPVLSFMDGSIRVMDIKLRQSCSAMVEQDLVADIKVDCSLSTVRKLDPFFSAHCQPSRVTFSLKYLLQHQPWNETYSLEMRDLGENYIDIQTMVNEQLAYVDNCMKEHLSVCGTSRRCLLTAQLFGDESEVDFWTVAQYYLEVESAKPLHKRKSTVSESDVTNIDQSAPSSTSALSAGKDEKPECETSMPLPASLEPLETCYDLLCGASEFKKNQLERLSLHETKRGTYDQARKCAETMMLLGQTDRAVQLLLETDSEHPDYYVDSLRACLVASIRSSSASQSTIKLVATNLIASGKLSEGVQLLCLIEKGLDACRYLQTYGAWDQAAWLAKSTLTSLECAEVMRRWVDHLCSSHVNQKSKALLVLLSLGEFYKVIEILYGMRHFDRATLFIEACVEYGLLERSHKTKPILEAVFLEYARYMMNMGNKMAASYYCHLAGDNGTQLKKEVDILFE